MVRMSSRLNLICFLAPLVVLALWMILFRRSDLTTNLRFLRIIDSNNNQGKRGVAGVGKSSADNHLGKDDNASELLCDPGFHPDEEAMSRSDYIVPTSPDLWSNNFTVLMLTFNRMKSYREAVEHYTCIPSVDRVVLLWANQEIAPPADKRDITRKCTEKLVIVRLKSKDLALRFSPFKEIRTEAVFNVDDDKLMSAPDLERAFQMWKKFPWGLVGPVPREHTTVRGKLKYIPRTAVKSYSLMLTSAVFLHREYLRLFEDRCVPEICDDINKNKNCEDIFMNFVVRDHCKCSGIFFVQYKNIRKPRSLETALSDRPGHVAHRGSCLDKYSSVFKASFNLTKSKCVY